VLVVVHDVILSSATDTTVTFAARRASLFALDALEGDADFLTRTCDCRTHSQSKKAQKKGLEKALKGLEEDDEEQISRESELAQSEDHSERASEVPENALGIEPD
jgi:endoribonuclease Dicer